MAGACNCVTEHANRMSKKKHGQNRANGLDFN